MTEIAAWLKRERRRQSARPDLLSALLSGGRLAYARHRLGFMALRMLLRTGLHAIEIQLLLAAFVPWGLLAPLITYRVVCGLLGAAHWGALETLRTSVRESARRRRPEAVRAAVETWLGLTLWTSAGLVLLTFSAEVGGALASGEVELRAGYALACVLRLALDSGLRSLHSGVFAVRRVHRPLWSTLCPDLCELAIIVLGFGELGVWSIPLATLGGGVCDAVFAFVFVRRAYRQRNLPMPSAARAARLLRRVRGSELAAAARHALANVSLQLDGLLLLALVHAGHTARGAARFAALYYVLRPLMAASTAWVRTFYFDLKLVESGALRAFRAQLLRFLEMLAVGWAALLAAITLGLSRVVLGEQAGFEWLVLIPFFVARSAFALLQIIAFGSGDLWRLLQMGGLVASGVIACCLFGLRDAGLLAAVTLLLAGAVGFTRYRTAAHAPFASPGVLDVRAWLFWLSCGSQLRLAVLHVDSRCARVGGIVSGLRRKYPGAAITRWGRRYVFVAAGAPEPLDLRGLIVTCGGALRAAWVSPLTAPRHLFEHALEAGALPPSFREGLQRIRGALTLAELESRARERFANVEVCDFRSGRRLTARVVESASLRDLISSIQARSRGREAYSERRLPFQIAVYAPCGLARGVFIADAGAEGFDAFRRDVHDASVRASWPELFCEDDSRASRPAPALTSLLDREQQ